MKEYFVEEKLNIWLNYCDILNDAHDKVAEFVLNGYANADLNKIAIQKITGIFALTFNINSLRMLYFFNILI
jgi:hypothetical protein